MQTSYQTKEQSLASRNWRIIDVEGQVVGRVASKIAAALRGKDKATYTPNQDGGDYVVVINADKVRFTGRKFEDKRYYKHSGYVGGVSSESARHLMQRQPEEVLTRAVKGMLPRTHLGRQMLTKLKVYAGTDHPHQAQNPQAFNFN